MSIKDFMKDRIGKEQYEKNQAFQKKHGISINWGYHPDKQKTKLG